MTGRVLQSLLLVGGQIVGRGAAKVSMRPPRVCHATSITVPRLNEMLLLRDGRPAGGAQGLMWVHL